MEFLLPSSKRAIFELPLTSLSRRVLVPILSYENDISFACKFVSDECLCTRPHFDREARKWAVYLELNTRREIQYLRAPMNKCSLFRFHGLLYTKKRHQLHTFT